jgi:hypothetical protein
MPHSGSCAIHGLLADSLPINVPAFTPGGPVRSASVRIGAKDVVTRFVMGRASRMEPMRYDTLTKKIQVLSDDAVRIRSQGTRMLISGASTHLGWLW